MQATQSWHFRAHGDGPAPSLPVALPYGAVAAFAFVVGWAVGLSATDAIVLPVALVVLGVFKSGRRWSEGRRRRAVADAWLRRGGRVSPFEWRAAELTSPGERSLLARSLRRVVRELGSLPGFHSTLPLNRKSLRPHAAGLESLAERLDDLERPVAPAGILEVQHLLTSPGSPLHLYAPEADVSETLTAIHQKLEAR